MSTWSHCLLQAQAVSCCLFLLLLVSGCMQASHSCTCPHQRAGAGRKQEGRREAAVGDGGCVKVSAITASVQCFGLADCKFLVSAL